MLNPPFLCVLFLIAVLIGCHSQKMLPDHEHSHAWSDPDKRANEWNSSARDAWQHPEQIVAALALPPGGTAADIGAGTGYMVKHLSLAVGESGRILALDVSREMADYVDHHAQELGPARVEARQVPSDDPSLPPFSIDGALALDVWHHMTEREEYAEKVFRALRRGSRFVVVDYDLDAESGPPESMRLAPEKVMEQLKSAGFTAGIAQESMPRHYMVVGTKE